METEPELNQERGWETLALWLQPPCGKGTDTVAIRDSLPILDCSRKQIIQVIYQGLYVKNYQGGKACLLYVLADGKEKAGRKKRKMKSPKRGRRARGREEGEA